MKRAIIVAALAIAALWYPLRASSFDAVQMPDGEVVFVFSRGEMEQLDAAIGKLLQENESMKKRLDKSNCTSI